MSHSAEFNRNAALVASGVLMGFVGAMGGNTQAASDTELLYADAQGAETCVQNLEDYAERRSRHHLSLARAACGDAVVLRVRFKDDPSNTALFDMGIDSDGELQGYREAARDGTRSKSDCSSRPEAGRQAAGA